MKKITLPVSVLFLLLSFFAFSGCQQDISSKPENSTVDSLQRTESLQAVHQSLESTTSEQDDEFAISDPALDPALKGKIKTEALTEGNKVKMVSINVEFPQLVALQNDKIQKKINAAIKNLMSKRIAAFHKLLLDEDKLGKPEQISEDDRNTLDVGYEVSLLNDHIFSIHFTSTEYFIGAAHSNDFSSVANFNLSTGNQIQYADFFKKNSNYLKMISDIAIQDLQQQFKTNPDYASDSLTEDQIQWIKDGTAPKLENLKNFSITAQGLVIYFDPYQVAAYAFGPQTVFIPFKEMATILDQNWVLKAMSIK